MCHTSNLFYFLIVGSCAAQWTIDFNDDGLCNGTDLGRKTIDLDDTTCYDDYADLAVGVLVNTTDPREQVIAFYQTAGCYTEDLIAVSNTPLCVGAIYGSFKVTNTYNDPSGCCLNAAVGISSPWLLDADLDNRSTFRAISRVHQPQWRSQGR